MEGIKAKNLARKKRKGRVRKKIFGTKDKPRISVYKSNRYLYAQLIDDTTGRTLRFVSSLKYVERGGYAKSVKIARRLGEEIGKLAKEDGIMQAVFDRNGYPYGGRIKVFAEEIRRQGIKV